jgi:hypothetical protein
MRREGSNEWYRPQRFNSIVDGVHSPTTRSWFGSFIVIREVDNTFAFTHLEEITNCLKQRKR